VIDILNATKTFAARGSTVTALAPVSLSIEAGSFVALVGPSGCGKSTLLNMMAGVVKGSGGTIRHEGRVVTDINTHVGYMTQQDSLLPWRTTEDNIALPLVIRGMPATERARRVDAMLELVGLTAFRTHFPSELSGGMRKRVALAQVLAYDPGTLLMDEPFGALDAQLKLVMQNELLAIWERTKKTIVFVTHDLAEAIALADRVVVFSGRPGRIKVVRDIAIARPRDVFRIQFEPQFRELYADLWALLAPEIERREPSV
jgi:NitT/TauT family transport system ATP-binding protein